MGAAAVGASIVSRRGRDRGDDEDRVVSCSPSAAAAATPAAGVGGVAGYGDVVMTREQVKELRCFFVPYAFVFVLSVWLSDGRAKRLTDEKASVKCG